MSGARRFEPLSAGSGPPDDGGAPARGALFSPDPFAAAPAKGVSTAAVRLQRKDVS